MIGKPGEQMVGLKYKLALLWIVSKLIGRGEVCLVFILFWVSRLGRVIGVDKGNGVKGVERLNSNQLKQIRRNPHFQL